MLKRESRAEILLLSVTLIWGGTFAFIKWGLEDISPLMLIGVRFLAAFLILTAINPRRFFSGDKKTYCRGLIMGFILFTGYLFQTLGLQYTSVARSGFLTYIYALIVPFLQFFLIGKKPSRGNLTGLLIVSAGMLLLSRPDGNGSVYGDILTILGAFGYAGHIYLLAIWTEDSDPFILTICQFLVSGLVGLSLAFLFEDIVFVPTIRLGISMTYLVLPGTVLAIFIMNRFQHYVTPTKAVILYSMEPVFSPIAGILLIHEFPGISEVAGSLIILSGVLVSELSEIRKTDTNSEIDTPTSGDP